jgi:hypothetical protein
MGPGADGAWRCFAAEQTILQAKRSVIIVETGQQLQRRLRNLTVVKKHHQRKEAGIVICGPQSQQTARRQSSRSRGIHLLFIQRFVGDAAVPARRARTLLDPRNNSRL